MCKYYSGVLTVVGGAGDVTVNLPFDWTNGYLKDYMSRNITEWTNQANSIYCIDTSYDALTNAQYTVTNSLAHHVSAPAHALYNLSVLNVSGQPKSATTTTLVINDDGIDTEYIKIFIWA